MKIAWKKLDKALHVQLKKCVKQKHPCVFYFYVCYLQVNFAQNVNPVLKKSVRYNKCPL